MQYASMSRTHSMRQQHPDLLRHPPRHVMLYQAGSPYHLSRGRYNPQISRKRCYVPALLWLDNTLTLRCSNSSIVDKQSVPHMRLVNSPTLYYRSTLSRSMTMRYNGGCRQPLPTGNILFPRVLSFNGCPHGISFVDINALLFFFESKHYEVDCVETRL
jgi:hypothetical protein